jgi:inosine/xanthosine triphosphate pyrophosphatase family protein
MNILIGTRNEYKATEMAWFLAGIAGLKIHFLKDTDIKISVEENQVTLKANAEKKAIEISRHTDWCVLASDGGVAIPGLRERWDMMKNQRTVGEKKTDWEKVEVLIDLMKDLKGEDRKCAYHLALALARNGQLLWSFEDITDRGYIIEKPDNTEIPPYRWIGHIWYYPEFKKTFNQMTEEERNEVRKQGYKIKLKLRRFYDQKLVN